MKIDIQPFNKIWKKQFEAVKLELEQILSSINPKIDHIGSTSVEGLSAKPIIDILIGVENENQLNECIEPLIKNGFIYFQIYNTLMPYRRLFLKVIKNETISSVIETEEDLNQDFLVHSNTIAHIHIIPNSSIHWLRHIAFKEYLLNNKEVAAEYQKLKEQLSQNEWKNGNEYNSAKNDFIKHHEEIAIKQYKINNYS